MYYAHIRDDGKMQTVEEHLSGTARLASEFAAAFGEEKRGYMIGMAHDIGKTSTEFQNRLFGGKKVDHATAGALECAKIRENMAACCVIGHHGGLPDLGNVRNDYPGIPTCVGRLKKGINGGIPKYHWDSPLPAPGRLPLLQDSFSQALWTKMLYSCLVDADYLDTEAFMSTSSPARTGYDPMDVLLKRLENHVTPWFPGNSELNRNRCIVLRQCMDAAAQPRGAYSLTVPTGGGKTISSLAFALKHAVAHNLDRVIYVIPYTSIIEQNAQVFRDILGENNVIEHHSGISFDGDEETNQENRFARLAAENWDAPVIVTTSVQFFESLYSNRSSQCRKLHNMANSVIIFDEAQMIPTCHLSPCVGAIANLSAHFRSTIVLCTATQPVLADLFRQFCPELEIKELCPHVEESYQKFQRVAYRDGGSMSNESLANELGTKKQVLCIVNSRKTAQQIYALLPEDGSFHLSTLMYPEHRKSILEIIRQRLKSNLPCRVVSTSLIEAGVDVDFPFVYRELAGLDSVAQAAGRCNREGKRSAQDSIVTYYRGENPVPILQKENISAAFEALKHGSPDDPNVMDIYFKTLRNIIGKNTDKCGVVNSLRNGISGCAFPFETVAKNFQFISDASRTIYIPIDDGKELCNLLEHGKAGREDYRRAGQFGVCCYDNHYRALLSAGDIVPVGQDSAILKNLKLYSFKTGLSLIAETGKGDFI